MFKAVQISCAVASVYFPLLIVESSKTECLPCRHQKLGEMSPIAAQRISCNCYAISHSEFSSGQMWMCLGSEACPQSAGTSALVIGGRNCHRRRAFSSTLSYEGATYCTPSPQSRTLHS